VGNQKASTQYNQSTTDFSRRLVATFVAESKENFRIPFFFNYFKSDIYSSHIIRDKKEKYRRLSQRAIEYLKKSIKGV